MTAVEFNNLDEESREILKNSSEAANQIDQINQAYFIAFQDDFIGAMRILQKILEQRQRPEPDPAFPNANEAQNQQFRYF